MLFRSLDLVPSRAPGQHLLAPDEDTTPVLDKEVQVVRDLLRLKLGREVRADEDRLAVIQRVQARREVLGGGPWLPLLLPPPSDLPKTLGF